MGLGLPLMQGLTVSQLRAVLAHEFGHFHGGDTKLGPWVYKTRGAIGRTLMGLSGHSAFLQKPFEWYGLGFLRLAHARVPRGRSDARSRRDDHQALLTRETARCGRDRLRGMEKAL